MIDLDNDFNPDPEKSSFINLSLVAKSIARVYASKPTVSALPWLRPSGLGVDGRSGISIHHFLPPSLNPLL